MSKSKRKSLFVTIRRTREKDLGYKDDFSEKTSLCFYQNRLEIRLSKHITTSATIARLEAGRKRHRFLSTSSFSARYICLSSSDEKSK